MSIADALAKTPQQGHAARASGAIVLIGSLTKLAATGLPALDMGMSSDPYLSWCIKGDTVPAPSRKRTCVIPRVTSAVWPESFQIELTVYHLDTLKELFLDIECWDKNSVTADEFIGRCSVDLFTAATAPKQFSLLLTLEDGVTPRGVITFDLSLTQAAEAVVACRNVEVELQVEGPDSIAAALLRTEAPFSPLSAPAQPFATAFALRSPGASGLRGDPAAAPSAGSAATLPAAEEHRPLLAVRQPDRRVEQLQAHPPKLLLEATFAFDFALPGSADLTAKAAGGAGAATVLQAEASVCAPPSAGTQPSAGMQPSQPTREPAGAQQQLPPQNPTAAASTAAASAASTAAAAAALASPSGPAHGQLTSVSTESFSDGGSSVGSEGGASGGSHMNLSDGTAQGAAAGAASGGCVLEYACAEVRTGANSATLPELVRTALVLRLLRADTYLPVAEGFVPLCRLPVCPGTDGADVAFVAPLFVAAGAEELPPLSPGADGGLLSLGSPFGSGFGHHAAVGSAFLSPTGIASPSGTVDTGDTGRMRRTLGVIRGTAGFARAPVLAQMVAGRYEHFRGVVDGVALCDTLQYLPTRVWSYASAPLDILASPSAGGVFAPDASGPSTPSTGGVAASQFQSPSAGGHHAPPIVAPATASGATAAAPLRPLSVSTAPPPAAHLPPAVKPSPSAGLGLAAAWSGRWGSGSSTRQSPAPAAAAAIVAAVLPQPSGIAPSKSQRLVAAFSVGSAETTVYPGTVTSTPGGGAELVKASAQAAGAAGGGHGHAVRSSFFGSGGSVAGGVSTPAAGTAPTVPWEWSMTSVTLQARPG
jgi:hypothetical protein